MGNKVCWATGPAERVQELKAELREQAARGEIMVIGQGGIRRGQCAFPYVRLTPSARLPRRQRAKLLVPAVAGVYGITVLALLWEARFIVMATGGLVLAGASVWRVWRMVSHSGTCPGLHCSGCKG